MRIDVEKYLLIGPLSKRDVFFEKVQRLGIIEFITPKPATERKSPEIETYLEALHILRRMVPKKEVPTVDFSNALVLAHHVIEVNGELEKLRERRRILEKEIARVEPFGEFSIDEIKELERTTGRKIQFFFSKKSIAIDDEEQYQNLIQVGSAYGLEYYISINPEKRSYPGLIEMHIDHSLSGLRTELASLTSRIDELEISLGALSHHKKLLKQGLVQEINRYNLQEAKGGVEIHLEGEIFAILGWVPKNKISLLEELADAHLVHVEAIRKEDEDRIPTYLENEGVAKIGEDLVHIYDTPSIRDRDPSLWVFFAFAIFFSVIVSDAGYGLILLMISAFLFYKFRKKGGLTRRLILLGLSLSIGSILWGALTFSFFGIDIPADNQWRKYSLTNYMAGQKASYVFNKKGEVYDEWVTKYPDLNEAADPKEFLLGATKVTDGYKSFPMFDDFANSFLLELALFMGAVHILLSFARYLDKNWAGFGWICFMVGSYLFFPSLLNATSLIHYVFGVPYEAGAFVGKYLLYGGLGLAAILALIQKKLSGAHEIMNSIQVFADVMSYLRLYALSLAGMVMASTFDKMGASAPIYVGPFIILAGHAVNFTLALMGGLIHGLRLNFIEWYHYSFEGGGKSFNPLKLMRIE